MILVALAKRLSLNTSCGRSLGLLPTVVAGVKSVKVYRVQGVMASSLTEKVAEMDMSEKKKAGKKGDLKEVCVLATPQ